MAELIETDEKEERIVLLGVDTGASFDVERSLDELGREFHNSGSM